MQGVLIASAHTAVRKSLSAILQEGRTVHECRSLAETLAQAAGQKFDFIFVDDVFEDGNALDLVRRLHSLGYGIEIIPVLLSSDPQHLRPFQQYGARFCIYKPFDVKLINTVIAQIEELSDLRDISSKFVDKSPVPPEAAGIPPAVHDFEARQEVDVREISQRFRRLMTRLARRQDLVRAFADCVQEQFDVDNVVILLPAKGSASFRVGVGNIGEEVRQQFFIPFDEPVVAALVRLGEPVWVHDCDRLGRTNAITAIRYGERLNVQVICPVLSRGKLLAMVGLSRFHRYENSPFLISLLRLFVSFFAEALENTDLYEKVTAARQTYRSILDAMPMGAIAVSGEGRVQYLNSVASTLTGMELEDVKDQPVERLGSLLADLAWETVHSGCRQATRQVRLVRKQMNARSVVMQDEGADGALILLEEPVAVSGQEMPAPPVMEQHELWHNMASAVAHNFKNALVPVKTCAELLPEKYESQAFRNSFFEVVNENITKIDHWIQELLQYAEAKDDQREWRLLPLHDALEEAVEQTRRAFPEAQVTLLRDYSSEDQVNGNLEYLAQMFAALVRNAFDAVQDVAEPRISVRTQKTPEGIKATVEDNGAGFDKSARLTAFDAFATTKLSGLGLGLAYVQKIAKLHNGSVDMLPGAQAGTIIEVCLPQAQKVPVGA